MKQLLTILFLITALMAAIVGCSSDEKAESAADKKVEVAETVTPAEGYIADSLAVKTYPIRNEDNKFITLQTDFGNLTLELYRDVAPVHVDSFMVRTAEGFYDGTLFFRIIDGFMSQGGDPKNNGTGNAGYYLPAEFSKLPHQTGTLSMARGRDPNSASCQFFVCLARNRTTTSLDEQYTVFGQLVKGFEALAQMGKVEVKPNPMNQREVSRPVEDVYLRKAYLSDAEGNPLP